MRPLKRTRLLGCLLLAAGVLACSCSGRDVSLGEDLHPAPKPTPTPTPSPVPDPTPAPTPTYPCDALRGGSCLAPTEHCSGRLTNQPGYECGPGTSCCLRGVGVPGPGSGGASSVDPSPSGAGGQ